MEKDIYSRKCSFAPKEVKGVIIDAIHLAAVAVAVSVRQQTCFPIFEVHIRHRSQHCARSARLVIAQG